MVRRGNKKWVLNIQRYYKPRLIIYIIKHVANNSPEIACCRITARLFTDLSWCEVRLCIWLIITRQLDRFSRHDIACDICHNFPHRHNVCVYSHTMEFHYLLCPLNDLNLFIIQTMLGFNSTWCQQIYCFACTILHVCINYSTCGEAKFKDQYLVSIITCKHHDAGTAELLAAINNGL